MSWRGMRGRGRGGARGGSSNTMSKRSRVEGPRTSQALYDQLVACDGAPYPAYKDFKGEWSFKDFSLLLDHIQADPFANPSKARLRVPLAVSGFSRELHATQSRSTALTDFIHRRLHNVCTTRKFDHKASGGGWAGAKGGNIHVDLPCSQVLERSAVVITTEHIEARILIALPAQGRSILGKWASEILTRNIEMIVDQAMRHSAYGDNLREHVESIEDQDALRDQLTEHNLVAFVRNGAILPRQSGASGQPLTGGDVVPFQSPPSLSVTLNLPNRGSITGMGLPSASVITCIGAGFHGKSTLLEALTLGCYNYIPGDGREFVASIQDVVSISSEDGRSVTSVDLSNFITNLPNGKSTRNFSTTDASGSTSCSASLSETIEMGTRLICIDEDTTASNWLASSEIMARLIMRDTITPLEKRIRQLVEATGSSVFLVCGSSGDFFQEADVVLKMEDYKVEDVTAKAKALTSERNKPISCPETPFTLPRPRTINNSTSLIQGKVFTRGRYLIQLGGDKSDEGAQLDLHSIPQLVTESQTRALVAALRYMGAISEETPLKDAVAYVISSIERDGLDVLSPHQEPDGFLARPRAVDLAAAINRIRGLQVTSGDGGSERL